MGVIIPSAVALILLLFSAALSSSCETLFLTEGSREYETAKGTYVISYNPNGAKFIVDQRRATALRRMEKNCGGPYQIVDEQTADAGKDTGRTVSSIGTATLMYIEYKCK